WMENDCHGRVDKSFASVQQAPAQFIILASNLASRGRTEISAKQSIFFKNLFLERKVCTQSRSFHFAGMFAEIVAYYGRQKFLGTFGRQASWLRGIPKRDDLAADANARR